MGLVFVVVFVVVCVCVWVCVCAGVCVVCVFVVCVFVCALLLDSFSGVSEGLSEVAEVWVVAGWRRDHLQ